MLLQNNAGITYETRHFGHVSSGGGGRAGGGWFVVI